METVLLDAAKKESIETAAHIIRNGGLVGMPTETVYGLAANALDETAVRKIFEAKGRPQDNPLIVHISGLEQLKTLVKNLPESAKKLAAGVLAWPSYHGT
jgi:L-threonylcarbamoyladenylate synthase